MDIAIQSTGKAENLLKIAMANNLVPTDQPAPGTVITIPESIEKDEQIVKFYKANNVVPSTALAEEIEAPELNCEEKLYECFKG
ncbi:hypothetical protein MC378_10470 [Polaribacter sp. MSW13]|uniref:LysM domain-containing protein n=1 Tax=Polaribacter marinus TaxID=2916838 RepID=A0A9X1VNS6_9FLAO|nr:hypothetical protein [Polaribacter marinus]MCI2229592.1 hypothetical protein [Polaribacter marinus]